MRIYFSKPDAHIYIGDVAWNNAKMVVEEVTWTTGRRGPRAGLPTLAFNGYGTDLFHSARRPNTRDPEIRREYYAATWDQWGVLLSNVFEADPEARIGNNTNPDYDGADDFHRQTGDRFKRVFRYDDLIETAMQRGEPGHHDHVFRYDPSLGGFTTHVSRCIKGRDAAEKGTGNQCSAVMARP